MNRKQLLLAIFLLSCVMQVSGQGFVVHKKDGSLAIFSSPDVDHISMVPEEDCYVFGTWYLGISESGSNVTHFNGTEYMSFAGKQLIWGGRGGEPAVYNLRFNKRSKYFMATNVAMSSDVIRWYITENTSDRLILKDDDNTYRYYYPSKEEAEYALLHRASDDINAILKYASGKTYSSKTPMGQHYENRHQTTDKDRTWLLNPEEEPNKIAGLTKWVAKEVTLYPYKNPVPADVNQHSIGDCCALAVFASFAYLYPDFIKSIITNNGDNTYTVKMYDPQGKPVDVCVSNKILCDDNGNIGQATGKNNAVTWATIMEKALIKWQTLYKVNEGVEGIGTEHAAPLFTGDGDSFGFSSNVLYTSELKQVIEWSLAQGNITVGGFNEKDILCGTLKTVTGHAFTFMLSTNENAIFDMRNPWGNGDNGEDGLLLIPDLRSTVKTIDARIVNPGAAAPYLRKDLKPYTPPRYVRKSTDLGVSPRLLNRRITDSNSTELW